MHIAHRGWLVGWGGVVLIGDTYGYVDPFRYVFLWVFPIEFCQASELIEWAQMQRNNLGLKIILPVMTMLGYSIATTRTRALQFCNRIQIVIQLILFINRSRNTAIRCQ